MARSKTVFVSAGTFADAAETCVRAAREAA